ncbi:type 4a pilus biogenesis protein PilO [uncultured Anaerovibrio sp.]|uniref:type 4a pilus biogenesis protein PilO n=1 Tax=uncultured Anaerovibrio sp. TaxID=361586 RepID=UPI00262E3C63|nr:type 4a pilus biogenesis protein PilO [uncultured Anaerovibrio sp.]
MWNLLVKGSYKAWPVQIYACGLILLVSLLIFLANMFLFFPYITNRVAAVREEYHEARRQVELLNSFQSSHGDIDAYLTGVTREYNQMKQLLPEEAGEYTIVGELQRQAENHQLTLLSFKPGKKQQQAKYTEQRVELGLRGEYFSLMAFFLSLQQHGPFHRINSLTIKSTPHGLESRISMSLFYTRAH